MNKISSKTPKYIHQILPYSIPSKFYPWITESISTGTISNIYKQYEIFDKSFNLNTTLTTSFERRKTMSRGTKGHILFFCTFGVELNDENEVFN